jgi:hypothetical protein
MERKKEKRNVIRRLFSGDLLLSDMISKQGGYLAFLFFLALFYIGFHYNMVQTVRQVRKAETKVSNLQAEYATLSSKLMQMNKQSNITRILKERNITGISAPQAPPKRIK